MRKFLTIMKREYAQVVKKKSFIIGIFLTPVLMAAFMLLPAYFAQKSPQKPETVAVLDASGTEIGQAFLDSLQRYTIDETGEEAYIPKGVVTAASDDSKRFESLLDSFRTEVTDQELKYVLVLQDNPALSDTAAYVLTNSDNFIALARFENRLGDIVSSRRLEASNINLPVDSVLTLTAGLDLTKRDTKGTTIDTGVKWIGAILLMMLIYIMILTYGSTLMRSVIEEKTSRIIEVLVSSVTPFQLMLGKIVGLGLAAFTTVGVWLVLGAGLIMFSGATALPIDEGILSLVTNPVIIFAFVGFLVFGYMFYSTFFALIGSVVNSDKEAQNFIFPVVILLMLPIIVGASVIKDPYSPLAIGLSYFPATAPTMMIVRVMMLAPSATEYSLFSGILGEVLLSLIVLILGTLGFIWVVGRIFRVGILMYGKRPTLPEITRWVMHK